jgi:octaprenyl-diphosphate synthase
MSSNLAKHDLLTRVHEVIGEDLLKADAAFDTELTSQHPYVTDVIAHVTRFRGKRMRPMLLFLTARACGGINDNHRTLAAVVEMIHTATLVHDDVLDDADTRRHVATVNSRWNNETSVLCGDYLFTHAFHLAASVDALACRMIGHATNLVCEGELCQVHERANCDLTAEQYYRIINGKTAELLALGCFLGAHYAGADEQTVTDMQEYGRALGMSFQIADDLLDILGNEDLTGKSLGSDYKKQKLTLPLIHLLETASETDRPQLRELMSNPTTDNWQQLLKHLEESGSIDYACSQAARFASEARERLSEINDSIAKRILEELPDFAGKRSY